jgi:hypothetical protein
MPSPAATVNLIKSSLAEPGRNAPLAPPSGLTVQQAVNSLGGKSSLVHVRLTVTAPFTIFAGADNAAKAGGILIAVMPAGTIVPLGAHVALVLSNSLGLGEQTAGELGIGTTIASGAAAILGGSPFFENFLEGGTLGNLVAGGTISTDLRGPPRSPIGTVATATSLFLNAATTFSDEAAAHNMVVNSGTIDLWYMHQAA